MAMHINEHLIQRKDSLKCLSNCLLSHEIILKLERTFIKEGVYIKKCRLMLMQINIKEEQN